ncbi:hypothetical protein [Cryobacterium psychrophilum]|uniref:Uncharacterized protein n=1 Tax=Cryobacterium psychrophilum TaxID=41988 RepID=A0A4Y8KUA5_9MICO|nr:hypothetical protein [Cryobacterium psychrophilum]TDW29535.1 hypothetical protein EDD25_1243 [Cryobacterium psychrophilum]TFD81672.1 hypothetical protein E3T53_01305 [Cryobacterium psychrophilum]
MSARIVASVVIAAGILIGTSACGFGAPQATLIQYDPSDGVSGDVGDVAIRNAMLLSADGETATLLVTAVNVGDTAESLTVQYDANGKKVTELVTVRANSSVTIGAKNEPNVTLENIDTAPGDLFPVFFQYGEETGVQLLLPVLTGEQPEYQGLLPAGAPSATPTAIPSAPPTEAPAH